MKILKFGEFMEEERILNESPNLQPSKTGLKEVVWISVKNASHGPRIKVYDTNKIKNFSVTIEDSPKVISGNCFVDTKELKNIFKFIIKNKDLLIRYWNKQLTNDEIVNNILNIED